MPLTQAKETNRKTLQPCYADPKATPTHIFLFLFYNIPSLSFNRHFIINSFISSLHIFRFLIAFIFFFSLSLRYFLSFFFLIQFLLESLQSTKILHFFNSVLAHSHQLKNKRKKNTKTKTKTVVKLVTHFLQPKNKQKHKNKHKNSSLTYPNKHNIYNN